MARLPALATKTGRKRRAEVSDVHIREAVAASKRARMEDRFKLSLPSSLLMSIQVIEINSPPPPCYTQCSMGPHMRRVGTRGHRGGGGMGRSV